MAFINVRIVPAMSKFPMATTQTASLGVNIVVGRGGQLVNGQNPASAGPTGEAILASLRKFGKA
jgi:hypothetical protein